MLTSKSRSRRCYIQKTSSSTSKANTGKLVDRQAAALLRGTEKPTFRGFSTQFFRTLQFLKVLPTVSTLCSERWFPVLLPGNRNALSSRRTCQRVQATGYCLVAVSGTALRGWLCSIVPLASRAFRDPRQGFPYLHGQGAAMANGDSICTDATSIVPLGTK